jgi:hypothetical protein
MWLLARAEPFASNLVERGVRILMPLAEAVQVDVRTLQRPAIIDRDDPTTVTFRRLTFFECQVAKKVPNQIS